MLIIECLARLGGIVGAILGKEPYGVTGRVRGLFLSPAFNGKKLFIGPNVQFVTSKKIKLGDGVTLYGNSYLNAYGELGSIIIGQDTHLDQFCVLYGQGGLSVGARCAIASGVTIYTQSNQYAADPFMNIIEQPIRYSPVVIGEDVWVGARAVILPGITVGDHAIIGAGAVVNRDVSSWTIVGGVPAKVIGDRRCQ